MHDFTLQCILVVYIWEVCAITKWPVIANNIWLSSSNYMLLLALAGIFSSAYYAAIAYRDQRACNPYVSVLCIHARVVLLAPIYIRGEAYTVIVLLIASCRLLSLHVHRRATAANFASHMLSDLMVVSNVVFGVILLIEHRILYLLPSCVLYVCFAKTHAANAVLHNMLLLTVYILL